MAYNEDQRKPGDETEPAHQSPELEAPDMADPRGKSTKSPAFQFYPESWFSSSKVQRMSHPERGMYIDLLAYCWLENGLPTEIPKLAAMLKVPAQRFTRIWNAGALHECFFERGGRLYNARQERERKKQADFRKSKQDAAHTRWISKGDAQHMHNSTARSASAMPSVSSSVSVSNSEKGKSAPIVARRRLDAAYEFERVYVPQRKHTDLLAAHGNEKELEAFYKRTAEQWSSTGPYAAANPGDMFKFWQARYDEWKPPPAPLKASKLPDWAREA